MELFSYGTILSIHIVAFMWNIAWVVVSDVVGALWLSGYITRAKKRFLTFAHWSIWIGLALSILSGAYLFADSAEYLVTVPAFYTKMVLVGALVINSFVISKHIDIAVEKTFKETTKAERAHLMLSGAVSLIGWVGVVVSAQYLGL